MALFAPKKSVGGLKPRTADELMDYAKDLASLDQPQVGNVYQYERPPDLGNFDEDKGGVNQTRIVQSRDEAITNTRFREDSANRHC